MRVTQSEVLRREGKHLLAGLAPSRIHPGIHSRSAVRDGLSLSLTTHKCIAPCVCEARDELELDGVMDRLKLIIIPRPSARVLRNEHVEVVALEDDVSVIRASESHVPVHLIR